jgi:hypothetical protein
MLTVWCLSWGDKYPDYYVQRLKRETEKYLTIRHKFVCITGRDIEGVECVAPPTDWPGWWGKIGLFKPGFCDEYNLWLDLDIVLTSNLDNMFLRYSGSHIACAKNWAASGHGGCQSSVMIWKGGKGCQAETIYRLFNPKDAHWPPRNEPGYLWGDQEWITHLRDTGHLAVTHFDPELIQSYKYHCRGNGLPAGCAAVVFHGDPKPAEVNESWFRW